MRARATAVLATTLLSTSLLASPLLGLSSASAATAAPTRASVLTGPAATHLSQVLSTARAHAAARTGASAAVPPYTCADFNFWEDATIVLLNDPNSVVPGIDTDGDGLACEDVDPETPDDGYSPIGTVDAVAGGVGTISVKGWAIDVDSLFRSDSVHVYVDGALSGVFAADVDRPDLATAFELDNGQKVNIGTKYGYAGSVPATAGKHRVCVYGIDTRGRARNTTLGCATTTVANAGPVGSFDRLEFFPDGRPVVHGWAADPDDKTNPLTVAIYVDGAGATYLTGSEDRPDVAASTGATSAGLVAILAKPAAGRHTACMYGINVGPGTNTLIGCKAFG